jgi:hypothetical protein
MALDWNLYLKLGIGGLALWLVGMLVVSALAGRDRGKTLQWKTALTALFFVSVITTVQSQLKLDLVSQLTSGARDVPPTPVH